MLLNLAHTVYGRGLVKLTPFFAELVVKCELKITISFLVS